MLNILRRRRSRDLPDYVADRGCPYRSVVTALLIEGGLVAAALLPLVLLSCCDPKASSERPAVFPPRATVTADDLDCFERGASSRRTYMGEPDGRDTC
jgi:hypothetical protein